MLNIRVDSRVPVVVPCLIINTLKRAITSGILTASEKMWPRSKEQSLSFLQSRPVILSRSLFAWDIYCNSSSHHTSVGTDIYDPSLKILEKWSAPSTTPESAYQALSLIRPKMNWIVQVQSCQILTIQPQTKFKKVCVPFWVMNCFSPFHIDETLLSFCYSCTIFKADV